MSDTEYTPTTTEVRNRWVAFSPSFGGNALASEEFDRWLAVHDAQVRAETIKEVSK